MLADVLLLSAVCVPSLWLVVDFQPPWTLVAVVLLGLLDVAVLGLLFLPGGFSLGLRYAGAAPPPGSFVLLLEPLLGHSLSFGFGIGRHRKVRVLCSR